MSRWSTGILLVVFAAVLGVLLVRNGGTFVYPLDDPAIHLAVARRLAYDGTWGIVAGEYQAASSSPLWTLLLAPTQWVFRGSAGECLPLVLNLGAAVWVLRLLRDDLARSLHPGWRRPLDVAAVGVIVVALLFLPGLAFVGMEHTLHMALVLAAAKVVEEAAGRSRGGLAAYRVAWLLLFAATLTRGETAFVAVGLALALLVGAVQDRASDRDGSFRSSRLRGRLAAGAALGVSSALALGVIAVVNVGFGQRLLPNSVLAKSFGDRGDTRRSVAAALDRLTTDPWLLALVALAAVVLVLAWHGMVRRAVFPAVVTLVTALLQVQLAAVEASLRYEAYIFGLGTWMVLRILGDLPDAGTSRFAGRLQRAVLVLPLVPLALLQMVQTLKVPEEANGTYEQRYQVAKFLGEAYQNEAIAIGELGYIALYHEGPLTDVYGLGDFEVLEASLEDRKDAAFWSELQDERGFRLVATYDFALDGEHPEEWIPVADWRSPDLYYKVTRFWATEPEEVELLQQRLRAYESRLPASVEVSYNELAAFAAANRM